MFFKFVLFLLDILVPRFVTEVGVLEQLDNGKYQIVGSYDYMPEDDIIGYDSVCVIKAFTFLGFNILARAVSDVYPLSEADDLVMKYKNKELK